MPLHSWKIILVAFLSMCRVLLTALEYSHDVDVCFTSSQMHNCTQQSCPQCLSGVSTLAKLFNGLDKQNPRPKKFKLIFFIINVFCITFLKAQSDLEFVKKFTRPNLRAKEFYTLKTRA